MHTHTHTYTCEHAYERRGRLVSAFHLVHAHVCVCVCTVSSNQSCSHGKAAVCLIGGSLYTEKGLLLFHTVNTTIILLLSIYPFSFLSLSYAVS